MSINVSNIPTYTDAQLLLLWRQALAKLSMGIEVHGPDGKALTLSDSHKIINVINYLESRVQTATDAASGMSAGVSVAQFNQPV